MSVDGWVLTNTQGHGRERGDYLQANGASLVSDLQPLPGNIYRPRLVPRPEPELGYCRLGPQLPCRQCRPQRSALEALVGASSVDARWAGSTPSVELSLLCTRTWLSWTTAKNLYLPSL